MTKHIRNYLVIGFVLMFSLTKGGTAMLKTKDVSKVTLKNNLTLIHRYSGSLPIVSIYVFIKSGSTSDPADNLGLANITGALLARGTKTRTSEQIALEIESMGTGIGTETNEDYSLIAINISKKFLQKATELLSDVLLNPIFPENEIQKEKTVITAGIKERKDHIFEVAFDLLRQNIYTPHPYANLTQGTEETLKKISREDIIDYHNRYHVKNNLMFVVTGDIALKQAEKLIEKYFSNMPEGKPSELKLPELNPESKQVKEIKKFKQAYLMYGFLAPKTSGSDYTKLKLLNSYIGGGMSSLLFQELREKAGLGYEVHSFYPSRKDKSSFVIYIGLDKSSLDVAKEKINSIIDDLRIGKIDESRFNDAKKYLKGTYLLDHQTNARQGWYLGWWEVIGKGYQYDNRYIEEIDTIKAGDLKEAAVKYFTEKYVLVEVSN